MSLRLTLKKKQVFIGTARGHARTMKTLMGEVGSEVQKYNIRATEN